jgi:hypothetical protein
MDMLTENFDRNAGNYMISSDGRVTGIDHGFAWHPGALAAGSGPSRPGSFYSGPFVRNFVQIRRSGSEWADNDMSAADLTVIRRRLEATRPQFSAAGHTDWHDFAMARLAVIEAHARGTRSRLGHLEES